MLTATISAARFAELYKPDLHLLDVRTPAEHQTLHVTGAVCKPLDQLNVRGLEYELRQRGFAEGDTLYLLCQGGKRATMAAEKIAAISRIKLAVVEGGTVACVQAGLPTQTHGRKTISIERQVRIAAGSLVLVGALLGALVAPAWHVLSGLVGAGLVFAGVTDTCMMGMLLARMPWNQAR